jgi:hypothetical protein
MTSSSAINNVFAVVNWVTDTPNNYSNISYGTTPNLGDGRNETYIKNNIPSLTIGPLKNNTNYFFNYTSCDFAGNCGTSSGSFVTISPASIGKVSTGGGIGCLSNWKCSVWSACSGGIQTRTCYDDNNCGVYGVSSGKPQENQICGNNGNVTGIKSIFETELPSVGSKGIGCVPNFNCSDWSECKAVYDLDTISDNKVLLSGEESRSCVDVNKCGPAKTERQECNTKIPVSAKKVEKCFKNYIEVYNLNDTLISRLELVGGNNSKLNVQMLFDNSSYCPYCYDGVKDYDEVGIDCSAKENGNCPVCMVEIPQMNNMTSQIIVIVSLSMIIVVLMILIKIVFSMKKTRKNKK